MDRFEIKLSREDYQRLLVFQNEFERFVDRAYLDKGIDHALIPLNAAFSRGIIIMPEPKAEG